MNEVVAFQHYEGRCLAQLPGSEGQSWSGRQDVLFNSAFAQTDQSRSEAV
ncbi:hypothetical protein ACIQC5_11360 [Paenarthrobacter sp. NPDC092416]